MEQRTVTILVSDTPSSVTITKVSKSRWEARGELVWTVGGERRSEVIFAKGRSEGAAVELWKYKAKWRYDEPA